jgi:hypothetical protein
LVPPERPGLCSSGLQTPGPLPSIREDRNDPDFPA